MLGILRMQKSFQEGGSILNSGGQTWVVVELGVAPDDVSEGTELVGFGRAFSDLMPQPLRLPALIPHSQKRIRPLHSSLMQPLLPLTRIANHILLFQTPPHDERPLCPPRKSKTLRTMRVPSLADKLPASLVAWSGRGWLPQPDCLLRFYYLENAISPRLWEVWNFCLRRGQHQLRPVQKLIRRLITPFYTAGAPPCLPNGIANCAARSVPKKLCRLRTWIQSFMSISRLYRIWDSRGFNIEI